MTSLLYIKNFTVRQAPTFYFLFYFLNLIDRGEYLNSTYVCWSFRPSGLASPPTRKIDLIKCMTILLIYWFMFLPHEAVFFSWTKPYLLYLAHTKIFLFWNPMSSKPVCPKIGIRIFFIVTFTVPFQTIESNSFATFKCPSNIWKSMACYVYLDGFSSVDCQQMCYQRYGMYNVESWWRHYHSLQKFYSFFPPLSSLAVESFLCALIPSPRKISGGFIKNCSYLEKMFFTSCRSFLFFQGKLLVAMFCRFCTFSVVFSKYGPVLSI